MSVESKLTKPVTLQGDWSEPVTFDRRRGLVFIAGPCVIEGRDKLLREAEVLFNLSRTVGFDLVFKSSFDKANRTSAHSFRGVGIDEGLDYLAQVRREFSIPVITDVHDQMQTAAAAEVVDILQIPAFLCRQSDLLNAAALTGRPVMIKKGQFLAPEDMAYAVEKVEASGGMAMVCERGSCFGYRELVVDFRSLETMASTGVPVVFDATHSVQVMGGAGGKSGGRRDFVSLLARAAVAVGVDGIFMEVHREPNQAPSDGSNMLSHGQFETLVRQLKSLHHFCFNCGEPNDMTRSDL